MLLSVREVSYVGHIEMYTTEQSLRDHSPFEVEIAITNLKRYESPDSDEISALQSETRKLVNSIWNKK